MLQGIYQDVCKDIRSEIENIKAQLSQKRKQIEEVEDLLIEDRTNSERYSKIIARYETEAQELEFRIEMMQTGDETVFKPKLRYAISLINNMVMYIRDAPFEVKIKLIGSIFPEKVQFDGKRYRTESLNKVLELIYNETNELRGRKAQKKTDVLPSVSFSAQDETRTHTDLIVHHPLKVACLPISPPGLVQRCKDITFFSIPKNYPILFAPNTTLLQLPSVPAGRRRAVRRDVANEGRGGVRRRRWACVAARQCAG